MNAKIIYAYLFCTASLLSIVFAGEMPTPSEVTKISIPYPTNDFFGMPHGKKYEYKLTQKGEIKWLKFPMPFTEVVLIGTQGGAKNLCEVELLDSNFKRVVEDQELIGPRFNTKLKKGLYYLKVTLLEKTNKSIKLEVMRFSKSETEEAEKKL